MNREDTIKRLEQSPHFDFIIIGGGATGLGCAVDAASRGFKTLLIEQSDFSKGTSSRSTKLIHGGLRYLQQGNISLVTEALKERGLLCQNAPHLVHHLPFLVPNYHWWEGPFYGFGLKIYDLLAGKLGFEPSKHLSKEETLKSLPTIETKDLRGGVIYYDGQFDDSRLAITLAQTCSESGGFVVNYMQATSFIKNNDVIEGIVAKDLENEKTYEIFGKVVINATGAFCDNLRKLDDEKVNSLIQPSQGVHIVLDKSFLSSETAILVPHTKDGRVLFMVPWHDHILVGTTDSEIDKLEMEPKASDVDIDFLLEHASTYLKKRPLKQDILSCFAGIRPLVKQKGKKTGAVSRDHHIEISKSNLMSVAGGKWTTYRKMAEDTINKAIKHFHLEKIPCNTEKLPLFGFLKTSDLKDPLNVYGSEKEKILSLIRSDESLKEPICDKLPYLLVEVVYAAQNEMARTIEDVLARRTRILFLNAKAARNSALKVAKLLAIQLNKNEQWINQQVEEFTNLSKSYLPNT